jgi:ATP-dependent helicase HrpA
VWSAVEIPEYLRVRITVTDHQGREVESGRDIRLLRGPRPDAPAALESSSWKGAQAQWERTGIRRWDFDRLPESIALEGRLSAYPALVPAEAGVKIRLFQDVAEAQNVHRKGVEALLSLHLTRDLKFLRRSLTLPAEGIRGAGFLGGAAEIEKAMYRMLLRALLQRDIRSGEAFETHVKSAAATMLEQGRELKKRVGKVLAAYGDAVTALLLIERAAQSNRDTLATCVQIREEIETLVPRDFLEIYRPEDLAHLPRYIKAAQTRAERAANDPAKDRSRTDRVGVFVKAYRRMQADLSPHASPEKREAVEAYRWMVEEFKVSIFAQELKTRYPVSEKRLDQRRREIERML